MDKKEIEEWFNRAIKTVTFRSTVTVKDEETGKKTTTLLSECTLVDNEDEL